MRVPPLSPKEKNWLSETSLASVWQVMKTISVLVYFVRKNCVIQK